MSELDGDKPRQPGGRWIKGAGSPNPGGKKRQPDPEGATPANPGRNPDGTFAKGNAVNLAGKPKGARHRASLLAEKLIDGQSEQLVQKAVQMALGGDASVMRALLDRLVPPRKDRAVALDMPKVETTGDLVAAASAIAQAVGDGELTPAEGADLSRLFANVAQTIEVADLDERLAALEARLAEKGELK